MVRFRLSVGGERIYLLNFQGRKVKATLGFLQVIKLSSWESPPMQSLHMFSLLGYRIWFSHIPALLNVQHSAELNVDLWSLCCFECQRKRLLLCTSTVLFTLHVFFTYRHVTAPLELSLPLTFSCEKFFSSFEQCKLFMFAVSLHSFA